MKREVAAPPPTPTVSYWPIDSAPALHAAALASVLNVTARRAALQGQHELDDGAVVCGALRAWPPRFVYDASTARAACETRPQFPTHARSHPAQLFPPSQALLR